MISLDVQRHALVDSSPLIASARITLGARPISPATPRGAHDAIEERLSLLSELPLLYSLPREHLATLAADSQIACFAAGEAVIRQGEPGDSLYLVVEGRVEVLARVVRDGLSTESAVAMVCPPSQPSHRFLKAKQWVNSRSWMDCLGLPLVSPPCLPSV
jgi:hypothetical protein